MGVSQSSCSPWVLPPSTSGDPWRIYISLFAPDLPLSTPWESLSRARALGREGR